MVPAVPLRGGAIFPGGVTSISIGRRRSLNAVRAAREHRSDIIILIQIDDTESPSDHDLAPVGILATVRELSHSAQNGQQMTVDLHRRVRFHRIDKHEPYMIASYSELDELTDARHPALAGRAIAYIEEYATLLGEVNRSVLNNLRTKRTAGKLADYAAGLLSMPSELEIEVLTQLDGSGRLELVINYLQQEIQISEVRNQIQQDAKDEADKQQRDYYLREQMKVIRKELGEDSESTIEGLQRKLLDAEMPDAVTERAMKELTRMERQGEQSADSAVIRAWLDTLVDLPWNALTEDNLDVDHVRDVLDEDHYGLDDVKERIVEYVAVRKLAGSRMRGAIINLNGPPGVGKTSIASSVARAMGREMARISLGGVRDESEIRGHRRTYIGAIPGRIIRALRDAKTRNPVIVFDEIDKVGNDWRGDPASALLEVLDPQQNNAFTDHYLEVPFDLSQAIFITTSNDAQKIPDALRDRMETIEMSGYIEDEKIEIAHGYLIPRQVADHGLAEAGVQFDPAALKRLVRHYTYEAGVRQLERTIGAVVRKVAVQVARGDFDGVHVSAADIETHLGPEKFTFGMAEEADEIGVVTGLAVVGPGSDTLSIEVSLSEGNGQISLTGNLGNVMKESAQTALTWTRAHARDLGLSPDIFDHVNVHIHVPAGATPKDGPSAGIALTTAIVSAFTNRPVRRDVAMTGEVTLRGRVLPIGGLKAKTLAAHRAGIKIAIFPQENAKDIPDLPERIRADLELLPVRHIDQVLDKALLAAQDAPFGTGLILDKAAVNTQTRPSSRKRKPDSDNKPLHA